MEAPTIHEQTSLVIEALSYDQCTGLEAPDGLIDMFESTVQIVRVGFFLQNRDCCGVCPAQRCRRLEDGLRHWFQPYFSKTILNR